MTGRIVNLSRVRKQAARARKRDRSAAAAAASGRTKAETALGVARRDRAARDLDGKQRER